MSFLLVHASVWLNNICAWGISGCILCVVQGLAIHMSTKLERICQIQELINGGTAPSAQLLAEKLEVSLRTIYSDIQYMKDRMFMQIRYDYSREGYINEQPLMKLPTFDLTDSELVALAISKGMLVRRSSSVFEPPMESALAKIVERRNGPSKELADSVGRFFDFKTASTAPFQRRLIEELFNAIERKFLVEIVYYATSTNQTASRIVEPYVIQESMGSWYLWAWCCSRNDYRWFALHRMKHAKTLQESFSVRVDSSMLAERTFQLEVRHSPIEVAIRFREVAGRYIKEKVWHQDQKLIEHEDGTVDLFFPTKSLEETKRWVLFYGSGATVLSPIELRGMVEDELRKSLINYTSLSDASEN